MRPQLLERLRMMSRCTRAAGMVAVAALVVIGSTAALWAQPLAERVPAGAVAYVGWAGMSGPAYEQSRLRGVIESTELPQTLRGLVQLVAADAREPEQQQAADAVVELGPLLWSRPWAAYVGPVVLVPGEEPQVRVGWLFDAGDAAAAETVMGVLREALRDLPPDAVRSLEVRGVVVELTVASTGLGVDAPAADGAGSLAQHERFGDAVTRAGVAPTLLAYVDGAAVRALVDAGMGQERDPEVRRRWEAVRDGLGLDGLGRALYAAGFDGQDWASSLLIEAPAPRRGLLRLLDGGGVSEDTLRLAPATATWAAAARFDLHAAYQSMHGLIRALEPADERGRVDQLIAEGQQQLGVDITGKLLPALGNQWMVYTDPAVAGFGGLGFCLVSPLRDADVVRDALAALEQRGNEMMDAGQGADGPRFRFRTQRQHDVTLHTLNLPVVSPSWAVEGGRLYVGLYPQAVVTAHFYTRPGQKTLLDSPKFQAVRPRLGAPVGGASFVQFVDLPQTAPQAYQNYLMWSQTAAGMIAGMGGDAPAMVLPPLGTILPHLAPAGSATWSDDFGYHSRSVYPFPGAQMLSVQGASTGVAPAAMAVGVLLPALGVARTTARQMESNTAARGIHQSSFTYAQANNGKLCNDIAELVEGNYFTVDYALSSFADTAVPRDIMDWPRDRRMAWVRRNASFVLVPNLRDDVNPKTIAVFGRPDHFADRGIPVAYNDNHTTWEKDVDAIAAQLKEQTGWTMDELIARQEDFGSPEEAPAAAPKP